MAYKVTKKEVMEMSKVELLRSFELCIISSVKEENFERGITKQTAKSYDLLKDRLLDVLEEENTYDNGFNIMKR